MTAPPLLRSVKFWTVQANAIAIRGTGDRCLAGLAAMTQWGCQLRSLAATENTRHRDNPRCSSQSGRFFRRSDHAPGGIFDPLFTSIAADAAGINAAIGHHPHLRRSL